MAAEQTSPWRPPRPIPVSVDLPESPFYRIKRWFLGPPLVTAQLPHERLGKVTALGVLAPDMISSSAYGSEEMLRILVPAVGVVAFSMLLPVTYAILGILILVTLSYREVVMVYTKAGGSYVVTRQNFGPRAAQLAAVALLIDYTLTVAVQVAAAVDALASAVPTLTPYILEISLFGVALLCYGNLRGIREAAVRFAFPTYFYVSALGITLLVGVIEAATGELHVLPLHQHGAVPLGHPGSGLLAGASVFIVLKSFANGGSSLTGLEAISNTVSIFRPPEGRNARRVLVIMCATLGALVLAVSWLAHITHAVPFTTGTPTVVSQIVKNIDGNGWVGRLGFFMVQAATMLILFTGGNTSFNGFPFLASFVAEDSFLPRQLTHRGHRLTYSNGILMLTGLAFALLIVTKANLDALIGLYAIGVFTGFTLSGAGLFRYHRRIRQPGWQYKQVINGSAAVVSALVVLIFAATKFFQGAWVVVVVFPLLTWALIKLNGRYRQEQAALSASAEHLRRVPNFGRHIVLVLIDALDLSTIRALRYARSLKPTEVRASHFVLDTAQAAELQNRWISQLGEGTNLELVDVPDRRIVRAALELAARTAAEADTEVTVLLPRRSYSPLIGRLLHDRTADRIAAQVSRVPHVAATIVPFDPSLALDPPDRAQGDRSVAAAGTGPPRSVPRVSASTVPVMNAGRTPAKSMRRANDITPIGQVQWREKATVQGTLRSVEVHPLAGTPMLEAVIADDSGGLRLVFYGRRHIPGVVPGAYVRAEGRVFGYRGGTAIANPRYELMPTEQAVNDRTTSHRGSEGG